MNAVRGVNVESKDPLLGQGLDEDLHFPLAMKKNKILKGHILLGFSHISDTQKHNEHFKISN